MEESLKARLIGAAVLVALAVLLIPELLSGRKAVEPVAPEGAGPRGTRTFTIELGQAPGQASRTPTTSTLPSPAATTVNAAPVPTDVGRDAAPEPVPARDATPSQPASATVDTAPAAPAAPRAEPKPPPASSAPSGGWAVQVGAFGSAETANKLVKDLGGAGYRAFVSPVNRGGKTLYRVRVGPEGDRAGAEQLVPRLKARGLPTTIVQND